MLSNGMANAQLWMSKNDLLEIVGHSNGLLSRLVSFCRNNIKVIKCYFLLTILITLSVELQI